MRKHTVDVDDTYLELLELVTRVLFGQGKVFGVFGILIFALSFQSRDGQVLLRSEVSLNIGHVGWSTC